MKSSFKVGWIPFWNLHPMRVELENRLGKEFIHYSGVPSEINFALNTENIHLAPSSSVCLLTNPKIKIAAPCGVIAKSTVTSVYWGINRKNIFFEEYLKFIQKRTIILKEIFTDALVSHGNDLRSSADQIWKNINYIDSDLPETIPSITLTSASASSSMLSKVLLYS